MRSITKIILHCSASIAGVNLSGNDIRSMHTNPVRKGGRGWRNPGYHYVVRLDGTIDQILDEQYIANGVRGHNAESIHICYVGGLDRQGRPANTLTPRQHASICLLLRQLLLRYPTATLHGHREFAAKACPCLEVREVFANLNADPLTTPQPNNLKTS